MMLTDDIELLEGLPIAYIASINSLVISDLHLGYEGSMARGGILIPKVNLNRILKNLSEALEKRRAERIIIVGDIKNQFSTLNEEEFNELYDIIKFTKEKNLRLTLIKGNHDNFVERYKEPFKLEIFAQQTKINGYLFFHGENIPELDKSVKTLVMGHEHPSIGIPNTVGKKERLRCFLYGKYDSIPFLVLPAMNYFASGTEVNIQPKEELLSPVFEHVDIDQMHAIPVGYGSTIDFGPIAKLRALQ